MSTFVFDRIMLRSPGWPGFYEPVPQYPERLGLQGQATTFSFLLMLFVRLSIVF